MIFCFAEDLAEDGAGNSGEENGCGGESGCEGQDEFYRKIQEGTENCRGKKNAAAFSFGGASVGKSKSQNGDGDVGVPQVSA